MCHLPIEPIDLNTPILASGGIVKEGTLIYIGNKDLPEAVIPLDPKQTIIISGDLPQDKIDQIKRELWIGGLL